MDNSDPSQQICLSGPARHCVCVCVCCVCVGVCEMVWQTREWWTRSDIRPLKQPRINGLNRRAPLEGCGRGNKDFHQPQCIHPSALPDPRSPAAGASRCGATCEKKGTLVSCSRHSEDASRKKNLSWLDTPPDVLCTGNNIFESRAPLVVWDGDGFQVRTASPVAWQYTNYGRGGERYKTLQGLQSRSRGKWNMENVTGVFWHFALWAGLKRFKHQLRSESGSYEYESPAWEDTLHSFYSVKYRGVDIYKEANLRGIWHLWLWVLPEIFSFYFNW